MKFLKVLTDAVLSAIYPAKCMGCDDIIPDGENFCDYCYETLPITGKDTLCNVCGCVKKECQCKYRVFHFTGTTAPFYNDGVVKQAMYDFKFHRKLYVADFFAKEMALTVKMQFYGIDFDAVVYVPMLLSKGLKRGYNQSRELAVRIAKILDIHLVENAIGCNKKKKLQHKTEIKERFQNVKGVYYPNVSLNGRTVLLVDDIKTTGATLDECAKALFKAGADDVYCITALTTKKKPKKESR